jgi:diadenylate cyclase
MDYWSSFWQWLQLEWQNEFGIGGPLGASGQSGAFQGWAMFKALLQVAILVAMLFPLYHRFLRNSHAEHIVKGLSIILLMLMLSWSAARALHLPMLEVVFGIGIQLLIIGVIVIFQPELRRILLVIGQPERFAKPFGQTLPMGQRPEAVVRELTEAVKFLSKSRIGALIVLESPSHSEASYLEAGTPLDARLSTELLLTVFHPKTPLHDGAVVIHPSGRVMAAGVLLPLTEDPNLSWHYGTRHRAAIGLSEVSDSHCIVVSEETGNISWVFQGRLEKIPALDELKRRLERLYHIQSSRQGTASSEDGSLWTGFNDWLPAWLNPQQAGQRLGQRLWGWFHPNDGAASRDDVHLPAIHSKGTGSGMGQKYSPHASGSGTLSAEPGRVAFDEPPPETATGKTMYTHPASERLGL